MGNVRTKLPKISRRTALKAALSTPLVLTAGPRAWADSELPQFPEQDVWVLAPGSDAYEKLQPTYNKRTALRPRWRAMVKSPAGLERLVATAAERNIPFAIRAGGHSFEGLSQTEMLSIDVRPLNRISFDPSTRSLTVGSGVSLGEVYRAAAGAGLCFPAGSCPSVGLSGHIQGGGFGLLSRALGLASDSMMSANIVTAQGRTIAATPAANPDLLWALQGGGGGTFGAASSYRLRLHPIGKVLTFVQPYTLPLPQAQELVHAWQTWAPNAPPELTAMLTIRAAENGMIGLRIAGQFTGHPPNLEQELQRFAASSGQPMRPSIRGGTFLEAVDRFSGGWGYESKFSKGKSDIVFRPLSAEAIDTLLTRIAALPPNSVIAIFDAYGGAMRRRANADTAFAFRDALYCIQYYASWTNMAHNLLRVSQMRSLYDALRPHMSGHAYVNYCDLDLPDWPRAYWGPNLPRLQQIKARFDGANLFRHAQSVRPR